MRPMQRTLPRQDQTVRKAAAGDADARRALVQTHGPMVYGLCRRMCSEPDDAYQEVWEKVFRALHRFDPDKPGALRSWVATITHRHLVDRHRRRRTRGVVVPLRDVPPRDPDIDERIARRQEVARLEAALQRLPEPHRRVVVMHHLQGVSLEEIAGQEGVATGTVKSRLHRARARLASLLGRGS